MLQIYVKQKTETKTQVSKQFPYRFPSETGMILVGHSHMFTPSKLWKDEFSLQCVIDKLILRYMDTEHCVSCPNPMDWPWYECAVKGTVVSLTHGKCSRPLNEISHWVLDHIKMWSGTITLDYLVIKFWIAYMYQKKEKNILQKWALMGHS